MPFLCSNTLQLGCLLMRLVTNTAATITPAGTTEQKSFKLNPVKICVNTDEMLGLHIAKYMYIDQAPSAVYLHLDHIMNNL